MLPSVFSLKKCPVTVTSKLYCKQLWKCSHYSWCFPFRNRPVFGRTSPTVHSPDLVQTIEQDEPMLIHTALVPILMPRTLIQNSSRAKLSTFQTAAQSLLAQGSCSYSLHTIYSWPILIDKTSLAWNDKCTWTAFNSWHHTQPVDFATGRHLLPWRSRQQGLKEHAVACCLYVI